MSKSRASITKLKKPIVLKNILNVFDDNRGFLTALDAQKMFKNIPGLNFNFSYQLISYNEKNIHSEGCIIKKNHLLKIS